MAFDQRFATRDEGYRVFSHYEYKAPPVVSECYTVLEDCRGVQFLSSSPMAARKVIVNPSDQLATYATKEEYHGGSSWPMTTTATYSKPSLPHHPPRVPNLTRRPNHGNGEVPQAAIARSKPMTSDEAAKLLGGIVITEYRNKKQYRA